MITVGFCQLPRQWFSARPSPSPSVYYFVCFAPFAEEDGGQAADSHDRWQSRVCVCVCESVWMCVFVFCFFFFLRGDSAGHDQYSAIVLPPHLIQGELGWEVFDWSETSRSHSLASDTQGQSAWNMCKMHHHACTLPPNNDVSVCVCVCVCACDSEHWSSKHWFKMAGGPVK